MKKITEISRMLLGKQPGRLTEVWFYVEFWVDLQFCF